ncbi:MAG: hypothetical protein U0271_36910 [Polyangiaceae bacterium]
MKFTKFAVLGGALTAMIGVFLKWIQVGGDAPKTLLAELPMTGMDNGGPVFLFFLALSAIGAGVGSLKRFGRGLAGLSFGGSLLTVFMAFVKYADIEEAGHAAKELGVTVEVASGYWVLFIGASLACLASLVALVKPEPKLAAPPQGLHAVSSAQA